jgi:Uma2 family endonuclease
MTTTTGLTLEQFLAREETEPASEYACGEVVQKPMPSQAHAYLQLFLGALLRQFLRTTKLGRAGTEWRCIFGPSGRERAFVPDLVYVSYERLARGDARSNHDLLTAPDLAVEIVSPGQSAAWFADKIQFYLLHGVRLVWVIDPDAETIRVFAPGRDTVTLGAGDTLDGGDVLPGFSVSVADFWAELQV